MVVVVDIGEAFEMWREKNPCSNEKAQKRDAISAIELLLNNIFDAQKTRSIVATLMQTNNNAAAFGSKFEKKYTGANI